MKILKTLRGVQILSSSVELVKSNLQIIFLRNEDAFLPQKGLGLQFANPQTTIVKKIEFANRKSQIATFAKSPQF
jgi:hypothetical protein